MRYLQPLFAILLLLGSQAMLTAADQPTVIRIGFASVGVGGRPFTSSTALSTAHARGLLEEEFKADGIRIEWLFHKGAGPAVNEAFAAGSLDFSSQGDFPSILGRASGLKTRIILAGGVRSNTYLAVPTTSTATKLTDLLGKRITYHRGTNATLGIAKILQAQGLSDADFKTINLDSTAGLVALTNRDVDGMWGGATLFEQQQRGVLRVIDGTRGKDPRLTLQSGVLVSEAFASAHPDLVQRVVNVLVQAADWSSDEKNRTELFALWAKSGLPAEVFAEEYNGSVLAVRQSPLLDDFFRIRYADGVKTSLELKLIRNAFAIEPWIDASFLDTALARLHLTQRWRSAAADGSFPESIPPAVTKAK